MRPLFRPWKIVSSAVYLFKVILQISPSLAFRILQLLIWKSFKEPRFSHVGESKSHDSHTWGRQKPWQGLINFRVLVYFSVKMKYEKQKQNCSNCIFTRRWDCEISPKRKEEDLQVWCHNQMYVSLIREIWAFHTTILFVSSKI